MPSIAHAQVVFQTFSGLPADEVVNTFTFSSTLATALDAATAADPMIQAFYGVTGGAGVLNYVSQNVNRAGIQTKWYKLSDTSATTPDVHGPGSGFGSPILVTTWGGAAGSNDNLPNQVAGVLSFHASHTGLAEHSGAGPRPAQRSRGRIYIGPLNLGAVDTGAVTRAPRLGGPFLLDVKTAADTLRTGGPGTVFWSVWSRMNHSVSTVLGGFVDDRFDTQRRRLQKASTRSNFGSP